MSLTATLSSALTGLNAAQASINAVAHNVANANTEGYVRKTLAQESLILDSRGAGVTIGQPERVVDEFLIGEVRRQASVTGRSEILDRYHSLTQDAFGNPTSGNDLGSLVGSLSAALEAFSVDHETPAFAHDVVVQATELVQSVDQLAEQMQRLRNDADKNIDRVTDAINEDLQTIHDLNSQIASAHHVGDNSAELVDKRDLAIRQLAEKIEIDTYAQDAGVIAIYTANGETLLDSAPRVVHYDASGTTTSSTVFSSISVFRQSQIDPATNKPFDINAGAELVSSGVRSQLTPELLNDATPDADQQVVSKLTGGQLQGLVEMRGEVLPEIADQLKELAEGLQFALNAAHNDNVAWLQPGSMSGTRTDLSSFAAAPRSGTATLAVIDANDGSTLLAFEIDIAAAVDETDLANQINTSLGAFGTTAIGADGQLEINLAAADQGLAIAEGDSSITVTDAAGRDRDYGFSHFFGLNDMIVSSGSLPTELAVRSDIVTDTGLLATAKLDVTTPPLTAVLGGQGDNRGAQDLAVALKADHDVIARGSIGAKSIDLGSYAAEIVANAATEANMAESRARTDIALNDAIGFRAGAVSSVNLDEELASLMTLQQAYSVAARVISVVDELLEELSNTIR